MGLTGDINNIMNAHNLAMVALTARMRRNYNDEQLKRLTKMKRLDIDPTGQWGGSWIFALKVSETSSSVWVAGWTAIPCSPSSGLRFPLN